MTPHQAVRALAAAVDARDWDALADLLAPGFTCRYVHTGEVLDAEAYVRLNREYPWGVVVHPRGRRRRRDGGGRPGPGG